MFKRSMFQLYLVGCEEAMEIYQKAFDATPLTIDRHPENGTIVHAELDIFGQVVALSERREPTVIGNTTQLCLNFTMDSKDIVKKAYEVLKEGADINTPLGYSFFSPCMFGLVDRFGVDWCVFTTE